VITAIAGGLCSCTCGRFYALGGGLVITVSPQRWPTRLLRRFYALGGGLVITGLEILKAAELGRWAGLRAVRKVTRLNRSLWSCQAANKGSELGASGSRGRART